MSYFSPDWTGAFGSKTYASLVELTAQLCRKYGLHPQHGGVIRHYDVTGKVCPKWFVPASKGGSDTADGAHWQQFLRDVANAMGTGNAAASAPTTAASAAGYRVKVTADALHIRSGNGTTYPVVGCIRDKGVYTIVETKGDWGRLKSGAGWICLRYCRKV